MKITVVIEDKNCFKYESDYFNVEYTALADYFCIQCGLLFVNSKDRLYVSDPYMDDSFAVDKIESLPNYFYKAYLESGEVLHIQCETPVDHYMFQRIKNDFKPFGETFKGDDFSFIFGQNHLNRFELHRYAEDRSTALAIDLKEADGFYYLTIHEFETVIYNREEVSSFEFLDNRFICSLKNGKEFNCELLIADYMKQMISDVFELYKNQ